MRRSPTSEQRGEPLRKDDGMTTWEYSIVSLHFDAPTETRSAQGSPAVALLNREGRLGWEAVGISALQNGAVAVLLKRPAAAPGDDER